MNATTTSYIVVGLGIVVTLLGYYIGTTTWGNILIGFGAAHIVLGILDLFRPSLKSRTE